jgi:predicted kinase
LLREIAMAGRLIVLGGLPGTGKSTIALRVSRRLRASWLRVDAIEQAMRRSLGLGEDVGEAGYAVAYAIAEANLALGHNIIADCVNPLALTRSAWRDVATRAAAQIVEVELRCTDSTEHRRRVEQRTSDIEDLALPDWPAVAARRYEPWPEPHLVIDTAAVTADEAASLILAASDFETLEPNRPELLR